MKKLSGLIILILIIAGCSKDKGADRNYTASSVIATSDLLLGGGCVDPNGNFIVFSPPTFEKTPIGVGNFIRKPSLKKFTFNGQLIEEYLLPEIKSEYNRGSYTWDTINGVIEAWDPSVKVTLAVNKSGRTINSNSLSELVSIYYNGNNNGITQSARNSAIAIDANDTIFVLSSAIYRSDRTLAVPPVIFKIDTNGSMTNFFTFPSYYSYPVGNMRGSGLNCYPMDRPDDIFIGEDGYVYVAMGASDKTFRISKSGELEELTNDIAAPVSIATDKFGNIFIASSQLIDSVHHHIVKPIEVIEIKVDQSRNVIYRGSTDEKYRGHLTNSSQAGKWLGISSTLDVSVSFNGDVFLVDPFERKIVRIY